MEAEDGGDAEGADGVEDAQDFDGDRGAGVAALWGLEGFGKRGWEDEPWLARRYRPCSAWAGWRVAP